MKKDVFAKKLRALGFTKKEAALYLSALESDSAPASVIAENAGLNRVSAYGILEKMVEKGWIQSIRKAETKHYSALSPEILLEEYKDRLSNLEKSIPLLKSLLQPHELRPNVRFFEGIEGLKKVYRETLTSSTEICNYANSRNIRDHWPNYDQEYVLERTKKEIFLRGLAPADEYGKKVINEDNQCFREIRLLPSEHFQVENEIKIYDNTTMIASFEPHPFGILIESAPVAETQRQIFEIAWKFAGK